LRRAVDIGVLHGGRDRFEALALAGGLDRMKTRVSNL
jgi:hypothetical protein